MQAVEDAATGKLTDNEKKSVLDKCSSTLQWLDSNSLAEKEEFDDKLKELQAVCSPIMTKLHQGGGSQSKGGPTVEEVD